MADETANNSPAAAHTAAAIKIVDRPELAETFADCVTGLMFDGQMLRIEFGVTRFDEMKPNTPLSGSPHRAAASRRGRSDQPDAADRECADPSRRGQTYPAAGGVQTKLTKPS